MMKSSLIILLSALASVTAHSWLACADYRGPVDYYDDDFCYAYPREWQSKRSSALAQAENGYQIAADTGYNYEPSENNACQAPMGSPVSSSYTADYPSAVYEQGGTYCLAWPMKNHAAAECTNPFIPDSSLSFHISGVNPSSDPTVSEFVAKPLPDFLGTHVNGQIDCLGFQRSPRFCDNTDRAMGTGCFQIPANTAVGDYTLMWLWEFNPGSFYSSCWDVEVVAPGQGSGSGALQGADTIEDNLNGEGGSICRDAWAAIGTPSVPVVVDPVGDTPASDDDDDAGTPGSDGGVVLQDTLSFESSPDTISSDGTPFDVYVTYSARSTGYITVDLLSTPTSAANSWYGKAKIPVTGGEIGTVKMTVEPSGAIPAGSNYILRAWMVKEEDAGKEEDWAFEVVRADVDVVVGDNETPAEVPDVVGVGEGVGCMSDEECALGVCKFDGTCSVPSPCLSDDECPGLFVCSTGGSCVQSTESSASLMKLSFAALSAFAVFFL